MYRTQNRTDRPAMSSVYSRRRNDGKLRGLIARTHRLDTVRNALYVLLGIGIFFLVGTAGSLEQDVIGMGDFMLRSIAIMLGLAAVLLGLARIEGKSDDARRAVSRRRRELRDIYR